MQQAPQAGRQFMFGRAAKTAGQVADSLQSIGIQKVWQGNDSNAFFD